MMKRELSMGLVAMAAVVAALLAAHGSSVRAQPVASIALPSPGATKQLYEGCNNVALTFPEGTSSETVVQAVDPPAAVESMWRHDAQANRFEGFSPAAPQASDLLTVNFLDAVWLCVAPAGPVVQPAPPPTPTVPASPQATGCPITLDGIAFEDWVTAANITELRNRIVDATAIPIVDAAGTCSDVVLIADGLSAGDVTSAQVDAYRLAVEGILDVGDAVYRLTWRRADDSTFSTLGVADSAGAWEFEPVSSAVSEPFTEVDGLEVATGSTSTTLTTTVSQPTKLGTNGYTATKNITVFSDDGSTISSQSETISFTSGLFWHVAATKEVEKVYIDDVECKKVTTTITFVTGFKSLSASVEADGYSASVSVEGRLGANGQHQEVRIVCADGDAFADGTPIE